LLKFVAIKIFGTVEILDEGDLRVVKQLKGVTVCTGDNSNESCLMLHHSQFQGSQTTLNTSYEYRDVGIRREGIEPDGL
jgi:hypothetical protein